VAKVDELMQLCQDLESRQQARRNVTTRLRSSSLDVLTNAETHGDLHRAWSRIHANWDALTQHAESINSLRDAILMLAVRGVLTDRRPEETPADRLLADLHDRRKALETAGVARRISVAPLEPEEMPFELPPGWCWTQAELLTQPGRPITYGILKPVWVETGVPTVRVTEMKTGRIDASALPLCDPARARKFEKSILEPGDLLISKDGTIGKTAFVPPDLIGANITQHVLRFAIDRAVNREFVRIVIDSPHGQSWMKGETKGVALQGINVGDFRRTPIPLPPLAEQERIARAVARLMELCDGLELAITQREDLARLAAASICRASEPGERSEDRSSTALEREEQPD
jgi:type I restriction enzyme S subunit